MSKNTITWLDKTVLIISIMSLVVQILDLFI